MVRFTSQHIIHLKSALVHNPRTALSLFVCAIFSLEMAKQTGAKLLGDTAARFYLEMSQVNVCAGISIIMKR